jgi:hypothetical protein
MNIARKIYVFLTGLFLVLLPVQFLLVGYGLFGGDLDVHMGFGMTVLHGIMLLMAITAAVARMWKLAGLSLLMFVMVFVQVSLVAVDSAWVAGLHPLIAFLYWPFTYFLLWRPVRGDAGTVTEAVA